MIQKEIKLIISDNSGVLVLFLIIILVLYCYLMLLRKFFINIKFNNFMLILLLMFFKITVLLFLGLRVSRVLVISSFFLILSLIGWLNWLANIYNVNIVFKIFIDLINIFFFLLIQ